MVSLKYSLLSLNVKGLRNIVKRQKIIQWIKDHGGLNGKIMVVLMVLPSFRKHTVTARLKEHGKINGMAIYFFLMAPLTAVE